MKLQNFIRMQMIVVGFGAAFMLASSAPAQEIDNTVWPDNNTVAMPSEPPAAKQAAAQPVVNDLNAETPDTGAINLAAMNTASTVDRESVVSQWRPTKDWLVSSMVVCILLAGIYAFLTTRRAQQTPNRPEPVNRRTVLS
jgi:hypothetical protein